MCTFETDFNSNNERYNFTEIAFKSEFDPQKLSTSVHEINVNHEKGPLKSLRQHVIVIEILSNTLPSFTNV